MNELVREIEEDIRRERIDKLWHGFGKVMVGVSVVIILATVVIVIVQDHRRSQAIDKTTLAIKGIDRINIEDYNGAIAVFNELINASPGFPFSDAASPPYYALAMLRKAQAQKALNQQDEAKKTYKELAERDSVMGNLAKLLSYGSRADGEIIAPPDKNSAFYHSQSEFRAWQLLQQGKKDQAVEQFEILLDDKDAPSSMHERITEVLQHIAPEKLVKDKQIIDELKGQEK